MLQNTYRREITRPEQAEVEESIEDMRGREGRSHSGLERRSHAAEIEQKLQPADKFKEYKTVNSKFELEQDKYETAIFRLYCKVIMIQNEYKKQV